MRLKRILPLLREQPQLCVLLAGTQVLSVLVQKYKYWLLLAGTQVLAVLVQKHEYWRRRCMRAAGSHDAARLHYGHLRKYFVVSDGPRLQDEQSPQRTFFDGWPLCLGKQAPQFFFIFTSSCLSYYICCASFLLYWLLHYQFFFFHSQPPVSCIIYAVLPALLACITLRATYVAGSDLLYHFIEPC